jgi:radical SAM protein with 4Fe4S-binding SPASM domain
MKTMATNQLPVPDHLYIELCDRCNLECEHCYLAAGPRGNQSLPAELVRRAIDEFVSLGGLSLAFSGGEPLLHPDCLALVEYARKSGLETMIATNGYLLEDNIISLFKRSGVTVELSLDGSRESTHDATRGAGSFAAVLSALERTAAQQAQDSLITCFTTTRRNVGELMAVAKMLMERGFYRIYTSLLEDRGRTKSFARDLILDTGDKVRLLIQFGLLLSEPRSGLRLDAGHLKYFFRRLLDQWDGSGDPIEGTLRISPEGEIYLTAYSDHERFFLGNLEGGSLEQFWHSEKTGALLAEAGGRLTGLPFCRDCPYWIVCGGGSPVRAFMRTGSFLEPDEFCEAKILFLDRWFRALS